MDAHDIIDLCLQTIRLKQQPRTGWSLAGVIQANAESVADHSWGVTVISWILGVLLARDSNEEIDMALLLAMSALHDISEVLISDIPSTTSDLGGPRFEDAKVQAEANAIKELFSEIDAVQGPAMEVLRILYEGKRLESRIVLAADALDMLFQAIALEENGASPQLLDRFFTSGLSKIKKCNLPLASEIASLLNDKHEEMKRI